MSHSPDLSASALPFPAHMPKTYPQFLLFGDSITQAATTTLQALLSEWYCRRLDVLNRGFSGYTAPSGYDNLVQFFPPLPPTPISPRIALMTVFFGANDACKPGVPQHVEIEQYKASLRDIVTYDGVARHGTKIILIVPAPINEWVLGNEQRDAVTTAKYAQACREIGAEFQLPTLDLWMLFMVLAGWRPGMSGPLIGSKDAPPNEMLGNLLSDGLHFTPLAYKIVFDKLVELIRNQLPEALPENLPSIFPDWRPKLREMGIDCNDAQ